MPKVQTPYDALTYKIIGLAMTVHRELGPGFPEEVYKRAMMVAMNAEIMTFDRELRIDIEFRGQKVGEFKLDFVVEHIIVVEFKAVDTLHLAHERQVISYLTASGLEVGLLINFGSSSLQHQRIFPPKAVQSSAAFQARRNRYPQSVESGKSVDES
ncbi:MAG: GxxExxY protein [Chloroflexi bacterium]|nr:GxxExxY protein [Chloroflexota bacterium]